jgi:hypothetical protein
LENIVIEHVLGRFAEVDDPFRQGRRLHPVSHVLGVGGTGRVIVSANAANTASDEMGVTRILVLHEDAVAAEDRRCAVAFDHLLRIEIDLGVDAEAADDASDWIPRHFDNIAGRRGGFGGGCS